MEMMIAKLSASVVSFLTASMLLFGLGGMFASFIPSCETEDQTAGVCTFDSDHGRDFLNVFGWTVFKDGSVEHY